MSDEHRLSSRASVTWITYAVAIILTVAVLALAYSVSQLGGAFDFLEALGGKAAPASLDATYQAERFAAPEESDKSTTWLTAAGQREVAALRADLEVLLADDAEALAAALELLEEPDPELLQDNIDLLRATILID